MGLDTRVYDNVKIADFIKIEDEDDYDFITYVASPSWDFKIKNLEKDRKYNGDRVSLDDIAYSYGTHNRFREHLIKMMRRNDLVDYKGEIAWDALVKENRLPFYDFINFSDCEGVLDWEINEKIYKDFNDWHNEAKEYFEQDSWAYRNYKSWLSSFDNGRKVGSVVVFG